MILVRDDEGEVRVFLNSCRHRGMRVCRTDRENASFLRCPYHGWAYKNDGRLMTAAAEEHYEEGELDKEELGLIPVAQLGCHQGLIFATWDAEAPSLDDFLGDMKYYLDIIVGRTGGVEVLGPPQVWDVETGWKYATDNFTDNFHVFSAHHSLVELGMLPNDPDFAAHGHMIVAEEGHILHLTPGAPNEHYSQMGLPQELRAQMAEHLTSRPGRDGPQDRLLGRHRVAELPLAAADVQRHDRPARRAVPELPPRGPDLADAHPHVVVAGGRQGRLAGVPQGDVRDLRAHVRPGRHLRPGRHGELGGLHARLARPGGEAALAPPQDGDRPAGRRELARTGQSVQQTPTAR